jgi:uncharacterized protein (DUF58 family)
MSKPMTELKIQRAILWLVILMGVASVPLGVIEPSAWWATLLGLVMIVGGVFGAWRVRREIRTTRAFEQTVLSETVFRQEIARTGRLDMAQQAIKKAKPPRWSPFGTKLRA